MTTIVQQAHEIDDTEDGEAELSHAERVIFGFVEFGRAVIHLRRVQQHMKLAKIEHWDEATEQLQAALIKRKADYESEFAGLLDEVLPRK